MSSPNFQLQTVGVGKRYRDETMADLLTEIIGVLMMSTDLWRKEAYQVELTGTPEDPSLIVHTVGLNDVVTPYLEAGRTYRLTLLTGGLTDSIIHGLITYRLETTPIVAHICTGDFTPDPHELELEVYEEYL